jgi:hypothetical protein
MNKPGESPEDDGRIQSGVAKGLTRRQVVFGGVGAAAMLGGASVLGTVLGKWKPVISLANRVGRVGEEARVQAYLDSCRAENEMLPEGCLVPEDEREAKFMISVPANSDHSLESREAIMDIFVRPNIDLLPDGSDVHLLFHPESLDYYKERISKELDGRGLDFTYRIIPFTHMTEAYIRDRMVYAGSRDFLGRERLVLSNIDCRMYQMIFKGKYGEALSGNTNDKAEGLSSFIDEGVVNRYPMRYSAYHVPVSCVGGDLEVTRFPNGKVGMIIGKSNFVDTCTAYAGMEGMLKKDGKGPVLIDPSDFRQVGSVVKALYAKSFGVDEVVILGEDWIYSQMDEMPTPALMNAGAFFHLDMIVKTATNARGEQVAFVSDYNPMRSIIQNGRGVPVGGNIRTQISQAQFFDRSYIQGAVEQLERAGYRIVWMPSGAVPAQNYVNSLACMTPDVGKRMLIPEYGLVEDAGARKAYEDEGFVVTSGRVPYMDEALKLGPEAGGYHCSVVVRG